MKKWITLFLAAALTGSVLVGCSQPEGDTSGADAAKVDGSAGKMEEKKADTPETPGTGADEKSGETKTGG